jgi:ribonuclease HII
VLWASMEGMRRTVVDVLQRRPDVRGCEVLVDGNRPIPDFTGPQRPLVKGDSRSWAIAAASIIAKVERDRLMAALGEEYPMYGFGRHKGYPTAAHLSALREHGPCPEHRRTFAPVAAAIAAAASGS